MERRIPKIDYEELKNIKEKIDYLYHYLEDSLNVTEKSKYNLGGVDMSGESNNLMELAGVPEESKEDPTDNCMKEEVRSIKDHKVEADVWSFLVGFKDRTSEWIKDEDTDCEILISKYLHDKNISTSYCFCRVSTKQQAGDTNVSLDAQADALIKVAKKNYCSRVKVLKISGSAYKNIPSKLQDIGNAANYGDSILVYRVDRLCRNLPKYFSFLEGLSEKGVTIYSHSDKMTYSSNNSDFFQSIINAQKESELIGKRVKMSISRRIERGDEGIGSLQYGKMYLRDSSGVLRVVDNDKEMDIVKLILSNRGKSAKIVAGGLNKKGIKKKGRKWTASMVRRIQNNFE